MIVELNERLKAVLLHITIAMLAIAFLPACAQTHIQLIWSKQEKHFLKPGSFPKMMAAASGANCSMAQYFW